LPYFSDYKAHLTLKLTVPYPVFFMDWQTTHLSMDCRYLGQGTSFKCCPCFLEHWTAK